MWESRNVLNSLLWEAAVDDMGIYCAGSYKNYGTPEQTFEPRTPWQDGWNAAVMAITDKHGKLNAWAESLPQETRDLVREMLDDDGEPLRLSVREGVVRMSLFCSDTFAYACADDEKCELADLPEIVRLWKAHGYMGTMAWIARKRRAEPVKEYRYDKNYLAAKADLSAQTEQVGDSAVSEAGSTEPRC